MPYRRSVTHVVETDTEVSFALVVRTSTNDYTFGGGRVTIKKPYTQGQLLRVIEEAVDKIVVEGNNAFPREKPQAGVLRDDHPTARRIKEMCRVRNFNDRKPA